MDISVFFRSIIENWRTSIVICNLDGRIIFMNDHAAERCRKFGGKNIVGKLLSSFYNEEAKSKVDMVVEWFKEDENNNVVFSFYDKEKNEDVYISAIRTQEKELIGYFSYGEVRSRETAEPYTLD